MPTPQSRHERTRAATRLASERVFPVFKLIGIAGASRETLARWIWRGRRGVYLDSYRDPETREWISSIEAVARFLTAQAEIDQDTNMPRSA